jgi:signal transduction histidine kinase
VLSDRLVRHDDRRRLRNRLTLLFVALALPTAAVIWQAWDQLKWEAWYQQRRQAEAFVSRVDAGIADRVARAEARNAADFAFLVPTAGEDVRQPSPLSAYPVSQDLPGVIGYFQVDPDGRFSTPLLPGDDLSPADVGLSAEGYERRLGLANEIMRILARNRLVDSRPAAGEYRQESASVDAGLADETDEALEQQAFDQLNRPRTVAAEAPPESAEPAGADKAQALRSVQALRLDETMERRNDSSNRQAGSASVDTGEAMAPRSRRIEKSAPPASPTAAGAGRREDWITTFASEVDPYQFSLLDSGHFVFFRNVWKSGKRYIQGMLVDQSTFLEQLIEADFRATTLAATTSLVVAYRDDVIRVFRETGSDEYTGGSQELAGSLLYRGRLSAPLDGLELVLAISRLPPGPGASVLAWTSAVIAIVFAGGFFALYRLGSTQIRLARQQQDFVSAVSHELKTPLTSIRMYAEMLREGWADEKKRQQYYDYVHDESERLTRLIGNVLQLAQISRDDPQIDAKPTRVGSLVDVVRSKVSTQLERAGFELELTMDERAADASIEIDDDCFTQVVINLVDNAIKFSGKSDRKRIDIGCVMTPDGDIRFSVRDYGPGIPRGQLKKIFGLFYRPESELTRETVGTGIGLAIVRQLTTAMGGSIDVANRDPGAEFIVRFPTC